MCKNIRPNRQIRFGLPMAIGIGLAGSWAVIPSSVAKNC